MSDAQASRVGSMFGPYHLKRLLGRGGMGEVYEAEHTVKEWTVAVKLMSENFSKDPVFRERMKREARIAGRLQEPHVVPIHDYGEIDGQMFMEMRLIEGTDLDSALKRFGPLSPPRAVAVIAQIASALDAAHAAGVMHRDVKPPNILLTRDDFAYLVDFGIASATTDERLTQLGTAVGTWKYMAPERFSSEDFTYRADIYSLACVLHEALTGSPPYRGDSAGTLVTAHLMEPVPRPSAVRPGVPKAFDAVIACGMAKKVEDRYGSAGDLALAAHQALTDPDQTHAVDILRRSADSTLSGGQGATQLASHPGGYPGAPGGAHAFAVRQSNHPSPPNPPPPEPNWGAAPAGPQQPFGGPPPWGQMHPPPASRRRNVWIVVAAAAAVAVVVLAAIGIAVGTRDDSTPTATRTTTSRPDAGGPDTSLDTSAATSATSRPPSGAARRLLGLLPSGYPSGACKSDDQPTPGAVVSVTCEANTDANGPTASSYGLFPDLKALKDAFTGVTGTGTIVKCPGGKDSPGTWWHNSDAQTIVGGIACATAEADEPQVLWSNQQTLVLASVTGKPEGPNLEQLYNWWTSHS